MTSRERVIAACSHQPPDRVPIDLNLTLTAYRNLKKYLRIKDSEVLAPNTAMEVIPDPQILERLGVDLISVKLSSGRGGGELPETIIDGWGIKYKLVRQTSGEYYEVFASPLAKATIDDLKDYPWPTTDVASMADSLRERAKRLYEQTDLALVGRFGGAILEIAANLLGMEEWYVRLAADQEFIIELLRRIGEVCTRHDLAGVEAAGEYLQIMKVSGEDLGMQTGPLYSPKMFHEILLPPLKRRWQAVRNKLSQINPSAKIMLHSCGAVRCFIPDFIDAGIDILDPVQPLASGMIPAELKKEYGDGLVFHGGVDIQRLLPHGTPDEVAEGTRECLKGFEAARGGFIIAPSHTVQADVPPENLIAMIETARQWTGSQGRTA